MAVSLPRTFVTLAYVRVAWLSLLGPPQHRRLPIHAGERGYQNRKNWDPGSGEVGSTVGRTYASRRCERREHGRPNHQVVNVPGGSSVGTTRGRLCLTYARAKERQAMFQSVYLIVDVPTDWLPGGRPMTVEEAARMLPHCCQVAVRADIQCGGFAGRLVTPGRAAADFACSSALLRVGRFKSAE